MSDLRVSTTLFRDSNMLRVVFEIVVCSVSAGNVFMVRNALLGPWPGPYEPEILLGHLKVPKSWAQMMGL